MVVVAVVVFHIMIFAAVLRVVLFLPLLSLSSLLLLLLSLLLLFLLLLLLLLLLSLLFLLLLSLLLLLTLSHRCQMRQYPAVPGRFVQRIFPEIGTILDRILFFFTF